MFPQHFGLAGEVARNVKKARSTSKPAPKQQANTGVFWVGSNGRVYVKGHQGINDAGAADGNTASYWGSRGFTQIADPNAPVSVDRAAAAADGGGGGFSGGGAISAPEKPKLDQDQVNSLRALLGRYDDDFDKQKIKFAKTRDASISDKDRERDTEEKKYKGKKLSTLQDYGTARTDTDLDARNTLRNLLSSLSTVGMAGSRDLTRQLLSDANITNRKANATQAQNTQALDSAWNDYDLGYRDDISKIRDQYDYNVGEAKKSWAENRQNAMHKIADTYNRADMGAERKNWMEQADGLNSIISNSVFTNPRYDGKARAMATPELADYVQPVAQYATDTSVATPGAPGGLTPEGGNLAVKAVVLNDKDLGVKKKTENELGYGV